MEEHLCGFCNSALLSNETDVLCNATGIRLCDSCIHTVCGQNDYSNNLRECLLHATTECAPSAYAYARILKRADPENKLTVAGHLREIARHDHFLFLKAYPLAQVLVCRVCEEIVSVNTASIQSWSTITCGSCSSVFCCKCGSHETFAKTKGYVFLENSHDSEWMACDTHVCKNPACWPTVSELTFEFKIARDTILENAGLESVFTLPPRAPTWDGEVLVRALTEIATRPHARLDEAVKVNPKSAYKLFKRSLLWLQMLSRSNVDLCRHLLQIWLCIVPLRLKEKAIQNNVFWKDVFGVSCASCTDME
jgi:hypothetical protein